MSRWEAGGLVLKGETPYVLRFDGRIPIVKYYKNKEEGVKARRKYRAEGYHVLLHPVPAMKGKDIEFKAKPEPRGDNNNRFSRFTDWRRRTFGRGRA